MAKFIGILGPDRAVLELYFGPDFLENEVKKYALYMCLVAVATFFSAFGNKWAFGTLGQNVTLNIRELLYNHIL
jgi:hypothetical protein